MKIVCISDTHTKHRKATIPDGDLLIHAGDICHFGKDKDVLLDFNDWIGNLPHQHKIVIAGNHDKILERDPDPSGNFISNAHYLKDELLELEGLRIWGSPATPWFRGAAFNYHRGEEIAKIWSLIPDKLDILITHGPPHGILDRTWFGLKVGCKDLQKKVEEIKPRLHIFGHIHEQAGRKIIDQTEYINASLVNWRFKLKNAAQIVDL